MESLNDLMWNPEDENEEGIDTASIDNEMKNFCMAAFCGGFDTAGSFYGCYQDLPYRTCACV